ncbi:protein LIKE COV 1-like [Quillaja saponaria]|uniref:Protein LIKE COV 1-like n=1 Tax=Quillaja saponaria TaxID=32244 RepID=A0AAD7L7P1_QUISA|nr:protein LIKE COV 1-like [Quillaja saponaria]
MWQKEREREVERLISIVGDRNPNSYGVSKSYTSTTLSASSCSSSSSYQHSSKEAISKVIRSWASRKFMTGCVILLPIAITFYITWWFIHFMDGFFSPIYTQLGIHIFGLGFVTSITFHLPSWCFDVLMDGNFCS